MNSLNNGSLAADIRRLAEAPLLLLMFDFDGTLSPIVSEPQAARIDKSIEKTVKKLAFLPNTEIWIVSGRALDDLKRRTSFRNLIGSHGLECPFLEECVSDEKIRTAEKNLKHLLKDYEGILLEPKKYSVSIHYRNYCGSIDEIKEIAEKEGEGLQITEGKKVIEIRTPGRNKGSVCLQLINRNEGCASFYAGDDITDEDAFQALKEKSVTVKVGGGKTSANYRAVSIDDLRDILNELYLLRKSAFDSQT